MRRLRPALALSTGISLILPGAAFAELSASEVWDDWVRLFGAYGYEAEIGRETRKGDELFLEDILLTSRSGEYASTASLSFLRLDERPDGSVLATFPEELPLSITADTGPEGGRADIGIMGRQSGLSITARGESGDITYHYVADQLNVAFESFVADGKDMTPEFNVGFTDMAGSVRLIDGPERRMEGTGSVAAAKYEAGFTDPELGGRVEIDWLMQDLEAVSSSEIPRFVDLSDPGAVFSGAVTSVGSLSSGPVSTRVASTGVQDFTLETRTESVSMDFDIGADGLSYDGGATGLGLTFATNALPFPPVSVTIGETRYAVTMPFEDKEDTQDFAVLLEVLDIHPDDTIWQMLDPVQVLPRDPAKMVVDLSGKASVRTGAFDIEEIGDLDGARNLPFTPTEMVINEISLSVAGLDFVGKGAFEFGTTGFGPFGAPPATGTILFDIFGIYGLLERLVAIGALPQDQTMGAQMMLGLFTRPGEGEDHLTTEITIAPDGSVFANGQQIQ